MSRFLFVVPPLTGHTNPTVAVGTELLARGHEVAWCGYPGFLTPLLPADAAIIPAGKDLPPALVGSIEQRSQGLRGAAAFKFLWEDFLGPLAHAMVDGVDAAVSLFAPDVMVVDQQTVAGALVARRHGIAWATSATTSADLIDPFGGLPKLRDWSDQHLTSFATAHGATGYDATPEALRFSDQLVVAFTTLELVGEALVTSSPVAFVGPAFAGRPAPDEFPWDWLGDAGNDQLPPLVLVSLGTVSTDAGERFFRAAVEAFGDGPYRAIVVAPPEVFPAGVSPNVMVRRRVPQVALLPRVAVVVSHAGHNTVCETLAHGIPLVVAPIRDDQPVVAAQVVAAGAGIRVKFARVRPDDLRSAVDTVLGEPSFRVSADRIAASFRAAGGESAAASHLEALIPGVHP